MSGYMAMRPVHQIQATRGLGYYITRNDDEACINRVAHRADGWSYHRTMEICDEVDKRREARRRSEK